MLTLLRRSLVFAHHSSRRIRQNRGQPSVRWYLRKPSRQPRAGAFSGYSIVFGWLKRERTRHSTTVISAHRTHFGGMGKSSRYSTLSSPSSPLLPLILTRSSRWHSRRQPPQKALHCGV